MVVASVGHQCPECVSEGRRTQRQALTHFGGSQIGAQGYVTKVLISLNVAVFLVVLALYGAALGGARTPLHSFGAVLGPTMTEVLGDPSRLFFGAIPGQGPIWTGVDDGAYHRMIFAMFIHYGIIHLLLNMYALWVLGRSLEAVLGPMRFLALYLISGLGGNVAAYLFSPNGFTAGASTAIYGLFAAYFVVLRRLGRDASSVIPIIVINVVLTFTIPGISIAGHLGGLVTGAIASAGLAYAPREHRTLVQTSVLVATFLALVAITFALSLTR
jgi:membrane associated rhomboid family serine protease